MKLKKSFFIALLLSVIALGYWEYHLRSQGYIAVIDDNKALWAETYKKVQKASSEDVVLLGSSRVHFDIQVDTWEKRAGIKPIMLASDGTTPTPVFKDIVNNTDYNGLVVIGIAPGLFFTPNSRDVFFWNRAAVRLEHYYEGTYAQYLNHKVSIPLENSFAFLNGNEEDWNDDVDLKTMLEQIRIGERAQSPIPPFYNFAKVDLDRNVTMFEKTETDTAFANTIIKVWHFLGKGAPPAIKEPVIELYNELIPRFEARGGRVVFLRNPSTGGTRFGENMAIPRKDFYDEFLKQTNSKGYHFEDYEQLNQFDCPEESHLYTPDAKTFTAELVKIMMNDGLLTNTKTN
ncbi:hypothetical protein [Urechidicola vernalis]|uniref:SGNH/GDSL hydrolase family protein n=1 Tax=Urechidicola vernalis TaxID=3075600 RepID=A0ABU2Y6K1_9FLAO|nr:hypothetical protein [Urechidicola sp. P050]MDT0553395.1 hypothetical protein [Urechidicola sp. P050]